ncbi:MAG TPA: hypothetical protein VFD90_12545 [Gaiellales bacterium]|jgi:hypothetical protein|nr:hypothetical protein [Gaiellales bacterium]
MRIACAWIVGLTVVVAAGSAPAAAPRLASVTCDDAARSVAQPGGTLYGHRLAFSWGSRAKRLVPSANAHFPFWSRLPIFIRAGGSPFTIEIAPAWHETAGMAWDARGDAKPAIAHGVRVLPCPGGDEASVWLAYPGGFYVARPACLPIVITIGATRVQARVPLGRACL